jgi:hypothetical protein
VSILNLFKREESDSLKLLRKLCERPEEWRFYNDTATNNPTGLVVWRSSSPSSLRILCSSRVQIEFSRRERKIAHQLLMDCSTKLANIVIDKHRAKG